jgi:hypothetical protein
MPHISSHFPIHLPRSLTTCPPFSLSSQSLGFTEEDSAGQTNIFAVEPKSYVQGTSLDETADDGNSTTSSAAIAGTVAAGAIFFGLSTLPASDVVPLEFASEYRTLSEYSQKFASESKPTPAAAPALAE